jgi:hypothetical protein
VVCSTRRVAGEDWNHKIWVWRNGQSLKFSPVPIVSPGYLSTQVILSPVLSQGTGWWWSRMGSTPSQICSTDFCQMSAICKVLGYSKCLSHGLQWRLPLPETAYKSSLKCSFSL